MLQSNILGLKDVQQTLVDVVQSNFHIVERRFVITSDFREGDLGLLCPGYKLSFSLR